MKVYLDDAVGWIGCALTAVYHLVQLGPFIRVAQGALNFEDSPGYFISSLYINSFLWMIYGEMAFSDQICYTNLIASLICLVGMLIYVINERKKYLLDSILNFLIIFMASWSVYKYLSIEVDDDRVVGKLCFLSSLNIYSYFYYILYRVIKEKNYLLISFNYTTIYFVNSLVWFFYGIVTKDVYVICPYSIGIILSLFEIIIFIKYERKYPAVGDNIYNNSFGIEEKNIENVIRIEEDISDVKEKPVKIISNMDK